MIKKKIQIPIYEGELIIYQVNKWSDMKKKFHKGSGLSDMYAASTFTNYRKQGSAQYIVAFRGAPTNQTVVHEAIHLTNLIFRDHGIKITTSNDEPQAYFTDWIFNEIEKFLTKIKLMKLTELKIDQEVEINGHDYLYKGIQKRKVKNFGVMEHFVFYSEKLKLEKIFQLHGSKLAITNKEGKLTL